jgi:hypothetical protein
MHFRRRRVADAKHMMGGWPGSGSSEGGDPARGQVRGRQGGAVRRNHTGHGIQEQRAVLAQGKIPSISNSPAFLQRACRHPCSAILPRCPCRVCRARRGSSCPARSFLPKCPSRQVIESGTHTGYGRVHRSRAQSAALAPAGVPSSRG